MKKVLLLVGLAALLFAVPAAVRRYGIAYELKDVTPEKRGFVFDVTTMELKYLHLELLLMPLGFALLLAALFYFVREIGKYPAK